MEKRKEKRKRHMFVSFVGDWINSPKQEKEIWSIR